MKNSAGSSRKYHKLVRDYFVKIYSSFSEIQLVMIKAKMFSEVSKRLNCEPYLHRQICIIYLLNCILKVISLISVRSANNDKH